MARWTKRTSSISATTSKSSAITSRTRAWDLIYLDPPFNSSATYNVLFKEKSGEESAAQITAFEDTWQWGLEPEGVYNEIVTSGPRGEIMMRAMPIPRIPDGNPDNMEVAMGPKFVPLERKRGRCCDACCKNDAAYEAEWLHVVKKVCLSCRRKIEGKQWSAVRHLFRASAPPK